MPDKPTLRDTAKALGLVIVQAEKQLGVSKDETKLTIPERIERILRMAQHIEIDELPVQRLLCCEVHNRAGEALK